jgi:outer membrane protein assembly factor BamD
MKKKVLVFALLLASCSTEKVLTDRQYFESATSALKDGTYDIAVEQYQKLMEEYPFSEYTEEAQLKAAYAQYMNEQYAEAIAGFQDFQRMHPTNANLPFAEYYLALSYMDQMGKTDRDQRAAENAHQHFQSLIDRYPDSPFAAKAQEKLAEIRDSLAKHELAVAQFYLHWNNPLGAESRLQHLLKVYPDTQIAGEALNAFGAHFEQRGDLRRAALAYGALVQKYPRSELAAEARSALAELKSKKVDLPEDPLAELVATLGRPSVPVAADEAGKPGEAVPTTATKTDPTDESEPAEPTEVAAPPAVADPGPTTQVDRSSTIR